MKELVDCTDDAFDIRFGGDGAGKHVAIYVEAASDRRDPYPWKKRLPPKFMGWRILTIFVPIGYIRCIMDLPDKEWY